MQPFDRKLEFQFAFFFPKNITGLPADILSDLPKIACKETVQGPKLRMRLSDQPAQKSAIELVGESQIPYNVASWTGGIWRLSLAPRWLTLCADALDYFDVANKGLSLDKVRERIADNLVAIAEALNQKISRYALSVRAEASEQSVRNASGIVATRYLNGETCRSVEAGHTLEVMTRLNEATTWELGDAGEIAVNRIEQLSSLQVYEASEPHNRFQLLFDVNTSPATASHLPSTGMPIFYKKACRWIDDQLAVVTAEASR